MRRFVASVAVATAVLVGGLLGAVPANALSYNFAFFDTATSGAVVTGSGVFDLTGAGPNYLITGIEAGGLYNGNAITSLIAVNGYLSNDNILQTAGPQLLSFSGFSFLVAALTPSQYNIYYNGGGSYGIGAASYADAFDPNINNIPVTFSASIINTAIATPLPAALPLFATGLGAMGLLGWRRKRKTAAAIAAA